MGAGEAPALIEPNWMLLVRLGGWPTEPPLGMKALAPCALMVTDDFLLWSECPGVEPFTAWLLLTIAGAATAGTAGGIAGLPFTGETEFLLPC